MHLFKKYRWYVLGVLVFIVLVAYLYNHAAKVPVGPPPDVTTFQSGNFSFTYARTYKATEYATGVVSVGGQQGTMFIPLVDVVHYKSDPDVKAPVSFDAFVNKQLEGLCGSDGSTVSVTCTNPTATKFTTPAGLVGEQVALTLIEKDMKTGVAKTLSYAPIYVFNTTASTTPGQPVRYEGVFIYPTFTSFLLVGTTSPAFVEGIADTLTIKAH